MTNNYTVKIKDYELEVENIKLLVKIHKLVDSFYVYVGDQSHALLEMGVAMPIQHSVAGSTLFTVIDSSSERMAKRFATKFRMQFCVSFSMEMSDAVVMQVESKISDLINELL